MSAVTLQWLRRLGIRGYDELADSIAHAYVRGSRLYTVEALEGTLACVEARHPWMHLIDLRPSPRLPVDAFGHPRPDCGCVGFRCAPDEAIRAGFVTAAMLPRGRNRVAYFKTEFFMCLRKVGSPLTALEIWVDKLADTLPESHPLAMFRPCVLSAPFAVSEAVPAPGRGALSLRLVVDNTKCAL